MEFTSKAVGHGAEDDAWTSSVLPAERIIEPSGAMV